MTKRAGQSKAGTKQQPSATFLENAHLFIGGACVIKFTGHEDGGQLQAPVCAEKRRMVAGYLKHLQRLLENV